MMNVLFVAGFPMYENKGGVQRVTTTLAKAFKRKNIGVHYLALKHGQKLQLNGFENHFLPNASGLEDTANKAFFKKLLSENKINYIVNQAGIFPNVIDFLKANSPETVKIFTVHHNCVSCLQENYRNIIKGGIYGKIGAILDFPWFWNLLMKRNKAKYGGYFKNAIAQSDRFVLLSETFIPELKTYISSWPEGKVTAIYNPVPFEVQPQALTKKENRILYVGRIEYSQKQCDLLLPIWSVLSQKFPEWHFDIIGDGSKLEELKIHAQQKQLSNIHFHGYKDPQPFLEKAKVLCMTSSFEGYGMVLVEAQAFGVVPVAFNSFSSLPSIIQDEVSGLMVTPFDINEYVEKLGLLMGNESLCLQIAVQAQQSVTKFLPATIVEQWINLFEQSHSLCQ